MTADGIGRNRDWVQASIRPTKATCITLPGLKTATTKGNGNGVSGSVTRLPRPKKEWESMGSAYMALLSLWRMYTLQTRQRGDEKPQVIAKMADGEEECAFSCFLLCTAQIPRSFRIHMIILSGRLTPISCNI